MKPTTLDSSPQVVFVVGPPRSGTKLLRDTLHHHPSIRALPRNLNEVWRGSRPELDHDEFPEESLQDGETEKLRETLLARFPASEVVVEKNTCHTLRMDYVARVFPGALFAGILRDPFDAVASIRERWKDPLDRAYLSTAFRTWRPWDVLVPGMISLLKNLHRRLFGLRHVRTWGPRLENLDSLLNSGSLLSCAISQWVRCTRGLLNFRERHPDRVHLMRYEDLVVDPRPELERLLDFLGLPPSDSPFDFADATYTSGRIGRGKEDLTDEERGAIRSELGPLLDRSGYSEDGAP